jgi:hypothetical protein
MAAIDPSGLKGFICKRGDVVGIALLVNFRPLEGVTQADINRIESEIERAWTGQFENYMVHLDVIQTNRTDQDVNRVVVFPGLQSHSETRLGTVNEPMNTYAHEAGHWLELDDNRLPRFLGNSIMAPVPLGGQRNVTWVDIQTLVDRRFHNTWKCGCE